MLTRLFQKLDGGNFGYGLSADGSVCVQLGTHGKLSEAMKENKELGGPKFYAVGTCPADYKYLHYGVHILGKAP
eukprot:CAMPEP_0181298636 /NCGR_PEP_ID=MMETSP1101-20121128/5892_1 /TAXON_ID=46948 /ORGANISM="Rhodomonas abbreviata, Strain Caron Lab Isolate" /LENGTH=73 /DNA_ID=CAMNT_0023403679 /DNA_START=31 /DNA_END=252 /DNA_ORIENTATION=-